MQRASVVAAFLALLILPALAVDEVSEPPHPRPNPSAEAEEADGSTDAAETAEAEQPEEVPKPKPSPFWRRHLKSRRVPPEPIAEEALAVCEAELRKLGGTFKRMPPIDGEGTCGMAAPYRLETVGRGVRLEPASQMTCETALAFARWVNGVVVPAADSLGGDTRLAAVRHGSAYICRTRNNLEAEKISLHAFGRALDVVLFEFEGRAPIAISPRAGDGNLEESFQRAVRGGACLYFTTVLGPGTDGYHGDHLHLDIAERTRGHRLCQ